MNKQSGFTLIELVAVLVILALLGAMAVPRFTDVSNDALTAAKNGSVAGVRSGHAMAIAKLKTLPQLGQLIDYVGNNVSIRMQGVGVSPPFFVSRIKDALKGHEYLWRRFLAHRAG